MNYQIYKVYLRKIENMSLESILANKEHDLLLSFKGKLAT